jgi:secreted PhoX family phosphatase
MSDKILELNMDSLPSPVRRKLLAGTGAFGLAGFLGGGVSFSAFADVKSAPNGSPLLGFKAIPASTADDIAIAPGYRAEVLISWGEPLVNGAAAFDPHGNNSAADQEKQFGDNNDGMSFFAIDDNRGVMAINNEYVNEQYLFAHGGSKATSAEDVKKSQAAHGVSIVEVERADDNRWRVVRPSHYNRRITANTVMHFSGPAAGNAALQTSADPEGKTVLGTFGNCANGKTPWGTYLTCEENFDTYFGTKSADFSPTAQQKRYTLKASEPERNWSDFDERFDVAKNPNEFNRHGWVVEIDPLDPASVPVKRTALGRFKHENAAVTVAKSGELVVYMGDDERGEYIYKFVSSGKVDHANPAANKSLLDEGTLYVAVFEGDKNGTPLKGTGRWMALSHGQNGLTAENGFQSQADILINARAAADVVKATRMDRPEWIAVNPHDGRAYCTLTNNNKRGNEKMPVDAANPRPDNIYGQIIRWDEQGDATAQQFSWDIFVLCGNPIAHPQGVQRGTPNITTDNTFNSPDGLGFDSAGRLWILTDGKYSNEGDYQGQGNNQMLVGDPNSGEIRRFMVGPKSCELTGITFTPDYRTLFVNVQHPGEEGDSHFPHNSPRPRSSVIMITREDGGILGA